MAYNKPGYFAMPLKSTLIIRRILSIYLSIHLFIDFILLINITQTPKPLSTVNILFSVN